MKNIYEGLEGIAGDPDLDLEQLSDWELFVVLKAREAHRRIHGEKKAYACTECDFTTPHRTYLYLHRNTHLPVPPGQLCEIGCGQPSIRTTTERRYICCINSKQCPVMRNKQAAASHSRWGTAPKT